MLRRGLRRITRSTVAMFSAMVLLAGGMAVSADEIMLDDSDDGGSVDVGGSIEAGDYSSDSAFLI